ncbi:dihydrodipicolinate reductase [Oleidesulfovibrio alaskensis G20]|jgi:4-hydroxy-tetrahydrodipicolinate reductase|uniref:4-hydroxy-tetrahydrodipicolinate reductase n=1 Tax=Oleidesulfovibrio alaskensis (strain ATCC BAA-1058 / DSM 17464 / G20) TaxID=207559 RepID=DAPB_OLEA2|nr:4-hydroxy-tetrahydrodipicolinate reductase [Oleidesulfovibrio alaskensis]Q30ZK7.1 RecName: Full=4-hydroxy-tetrahydrodipicolinate reductase; Short=HTPA reductase [Oleidesulfovibrio alaskensis G20]ABB38889.1 dihydrodipicolinate reductase [Oleidesulfovibrio alaskensis G20]MBG0772321.1 4-hydroxy-tetrahydrodipicolinate reductase [Oleidesulfovibrio alaskensis]
MSVSVIVMGAGGRMGTTITGMVRADGECRLAGVVEREGRREGLEHLGCQVAGTLEELLPGMPDAVVIDFTAPEASVHNARACARHGSGLVIGTTGFTEEQKAELADCALQTPVFWAPNMSVGVNVLLKILPQLVTLLGEQYDLEMVELHHNKKKDSPSGTALRLAECLAEARKWDLDTVANYHREGIIGERPHEEIGIQTIRGGDVVGVHTVYALGPGERIEVTHQAHSRETFAAGAIRAAKWLAQNRPGKLYTMSDML